MSLPSPFSVLVSVAQAEVVKLSQADSWEGLHDDWDMLSPVVTKVIAEAERIHVSELERLGLDKVNVQAAKRDFDRSLESASRHWEAEQEKRDAIIRHLEQLIITAIGGKR